MNDFLDLLNSLPITQEVIKGDFDEKKQKIDDELNSDEYKHEYSRHLEILNSFLRSLVFIQLDCSRSKKLSECLFCLSVIDDLLQSLVAIKMLCAEGIRNTCRRELRYIIDYKRANPQKAEKSHREPINQCKA